MQYPFVSLVQPNGDETDCLLKLQLFIPGNLERLQLNFSQSINGSPTGISTWCSFCSPFKSKHSYLLFLPLASLTTVVLMTPCSQSQFAPLIGLLNHHTPCRDLSLHGKQSPKAPSLQDRPVLSVCQTIPSPSHLHSSRRFYISPPQFRMIGLCTYVC